MTLIKNKIFQQKRLRGQFQLILEKKFIQENNLNHSILQKTHYCTKIY